VEIPQSLKKFALRLDFTLNKGDHTNMKLILILLILITSQAYAECIKPQVKVAVIDTGFGYGDIKKDTKLCEGVHTDFTKDHMFKYMGINNWIPLDIIGHGTNVVGLIEEYAKKSNVNYCIVILKFYSKNQSSTQNLKSSIAAIKFATEELKVDYINYSGGGPSPDPEEKRAVEKFLNQGGKLIAAAGNDGKLIGSGDDEYYPAMYDKRITVVGSLDQRGFISKSSNYGKLVNRWEIGEEVTGYNITLTGTSQATAVATGKILANSENKCTLTKK
jgi:subtilisin family serine protease